MKRVACSFRIMLLASLAAGVLSMPSLVAGQVFSALDYMPLNPGDSWVMSVNSGTAAETWIVAPGAFPVNGTTARQLVRLPDGDFEYHSNDESGHRWHGAFDSGDQAIFTFTPFTMLQPSFTVGQVHVNSGEIFRNGVPVGTYSNSTSEVMGIETVSVPAGVFTAIKVRRIVNAILSGEAVVLTTDLWVADRVGVIRQHESNDEGGFDTYELVSSNRLPLLTSALLPVSRSALVGFPVTVFGTMINAGLSLATGCAIALAGGAPPGLSLFYQTTDPATNQVTGTPNTPVDLAPGAAQSFLLALTPSAAFAATDLPLTFDCVNSPPSGVLLGINTLLLSASLTPVPDVIALAATLENDGIVNISGPSGIGFFAVASVNVGATGTITVTADTGGAAVPVTVTLCQTDPGSGICLSPPAESVTTIIAGNAMPTFAIFVQGMGSPVPFDPALNRVFVRFREGGSGGTMRGATSVAMKTL
jgi:hypothetical protein